MPGRFRQGMRTFVFASPKKRDGYAEVYGLPEEENWTVALTATSFHVFISNRSSEPHNPPGFRCHRFQCCLRNLAGPLCLSPGVSLRLSGARAKYVYRLGVQRFKIDSRFVCSAFL